MGNDWHADKAWTDPYLPEVKRICANYLVCEAPIEEDQERNTDLIVLKLSAVRVAVRIRRAGYDQYAREFTIRCSRPSGMDTELGKIIGGWGDYFFYGHADPAAPEFKWFMLGDLSTFRRWFNRRLVKMKPDEIPGLLKRNHDRSSEFRAFDALEVDRDSHGRFLLTSKLPPLMDLAG